MGSSAGVLGVIHGLSWPVTDWAAPPRRAAVVEIEHDFMRRVREWMAGGRVPPGKEVDISRPTVYGRALGTGIRVWPRRRSLILRPVCDCLSYHLGSKKEIHSLRASWPNDRSHGWMTSSARPSSDGGIVRPRALAVWWSPRAVPFLVA